MKKVSIALAIAALALVGTASKASAAPIICPTANGTFADPTYLLIGGCNTVITFNANGSVTTTIPNAAPYDGVEDTLVGVVNNTGSPITSFTLSGSNLFGFDGDGACAGGGGQYESVANCTGATDPNGYGGPGVTFSNLIGTNTGNVNFAPGIAANGGVAWFSLEEPPTLNIIVTPRVPEPTTLVLFGTGLLAVARRLRKI